MYVTILFQKKISIIGSGYLGLITGAILSEVGHNVTCVDIDQNKIKRLNKQEITIYEPGLEDLVKKNIEQQRLFFSSSIEQSVNESEILIITVGTPPAKDKKANLSYLYNVIYAIEPVFKNNS